MRSFEIVAPEADRLSSRLQPKGRPAGLTQRDELNER